MTNNKEIRTQLKVIGNTERHRFTGTFSRYGFKVAPYQSHAKPTLVLEGLRDETGKLVTDHLWLNLGLQFRRLGDLQAGDVLAFNGRVTSYVKKGIKVLILTIKRPHLVKLIPRLNDLQK
ncbi:hypothetical protein AYR62_05710 [Secundilactobacillus paracollinoides]|uniref:hypothetical protein n=1 Tax=Secundilactobacillus paracollinoides TaxID=240427 RepID=UPI00081A361C|nr:hypothetical protein [Secundilactobacillus paracollinoides]ANZ63636.1 hypothetical protein AYR62_05710 [Secundilactobacillus paracollinoides]